MKRLMVIIGCLLCLGASASPAQTQTKTTATQKQETSAQTKTGESKSAAVLAYTNESQPKINAANVNASLAMAGATQVNTKDPQSKTNGAQANTNADRPTINAAPVSDSLTKMTAAQDKATDSKRAPKAQQKKAKAFDYDEEWSMFDEDAAGMKYSSALEHAETIYRAAKKEKNMRQLLCATEAICNISSHFKEDYLDSTFALLHSTMPLLDEGHQGMLHLMWAQFYIKYHHYNTWNYQWMEESGEKDFLLWSAKRMEDTIRFHMEKALEQKAFFKQARAEDYARMMNGEENDRHSETLFDLLVSTIRVNLISIHIPTEITTAFFGSIEDYAKADIKAYIKPSKGDFGRYQDSLGLMLLQEWAQENLNASAEKKLWIDNQRWQSNDDDDEIRNERIEGFKRCFAYHAGIDASGKRSKVLKGTPYEASYICHRIAVEYRNLEDYLSAVEWCDRGMAFVEEFENVDIRDSYGYGACRSLKEKILRKSIVLGSEDYDLSRFSSYAISLNRPIVPNTPALGKVKSKNIDTLYFRIIEGKTEWDWGETDISRFRERTCVAEWSQPTGTKHDYKQDTTIVYVPGLPIGDFTLLACNSKEFEKAPYAWHNLQVCRYACVILDKTRDETCYGMLLDRKSGKPLAHKKIERRLLDGDKVVKTQKTTTDKNGVYEFDASHTDNGQELQIFVDGEMVVHGNYYGYYNDYSHMVIEAFLNKPVYRLGEEVEFAIVLFQENAGPKDGKVYGWQDVEVKILDPISKEIYQDTLKTDAFGRCSGKFKLPTSGLNGSYCLSYRCEHLDARDIWYTKWINVEAYKQPKFMVSLPADDEEHQFGKELTVRGMAASYSGVPINGAKVVYKVNREQCFPFWRAYLPQWEQRSALVAEGELTTKDDGTFDFSFVPMPIEDDDSDKECYYQYKINVAVTDINGETHDAKRYICIGKNNHIVKFQQMPSTRLNEVAFKYVNLDFKPLKGNLHVKVERLQIPEINRIWLWYDNAYQGMDSAAFYEKYPLYSYQAKNIDTWQVERIAFEGDYEATGEEICHQPIGEQPSGAYHIVVTANGKDFDTYMLITTPEEKSCQSTEMIWAETEANKVEVGQKAKIRFGSRLEKLCVNYIVCNDNGIIKQGHTMINDEIKSIEVPVTKDLLGGFDIVFMVIKEGIIDHTGMSIDVPYSHKNLEVEFESFRDKVEPGSQETWTLRITRQGKPEQAAMIATLYDEALSQFGELRWHLYTTLSQRGLLDAVSLYFEYLEFDEEPEKINNSWKHLWKEEPMTFMDFIGNAIRMNRKLMKSASARGERIPVIEIGDAASGHRMTAEDIAHMPGTSVESIVASVAGVGFNNSLDAANGTEEVAEMVVLSCGDSQETPEQEDKEQVLLRSNLSASAFFLPNLKSDPETGIVEISFTMPELLTKWHLQTMAWTKDLAMGKAEKMLISQKQLMVTPNVPRFLRHGDKLVMKAKVSNMGGNDQEVDVLLEMSNAQDSSIFYADSKHVSVKAGISQNVDFEFEVPSNVFVAQYKIVARGQKCSDGEQALIPVLSNRQLVTESLSMYINGKGEKHYSFDNFKQSSANPSSTLENYSMQLEWTTNPMWYAIQSIPHLEEQKSPSHIYLANQIFVNHLGLNFLEQNPSIEEILNQWKEESPDAFLSQLEKNENLKQTVIGETPWLRAARKESEQHRQLGEFFDREKIADNLSSAEAKLIDGQMCSGGWGWIPESKYESLYTTERILQQMGELQQRGVKFSPEMMETLKKALNYADAEEQENYVKKHKKNTEFSATDIYYLYMRSFWQDEKFENHNDEAYNTYYKNALAKFRSYTNLYTRAQLAIIFNRHGDKKVAREMAIAIKEAALYSDEMGMYWRDNTSSYWWYQRPIETQAMLIEMMNEVLGDKESIALMQQWLLKQKQTTHWSNDVATTHAINALMIGNANLADGSQPGAMEIMVGSKSVDAKAQKGTGYISKNWKADEITSDMGEITLKKNTDGIAWGAMFWQYFEDLDKIPYSEMGIKMQKQLFRLDPDDKMTPVSEAKVGDKIRVRILIDCDRNLEYLEIKDQRASGMEPISTRSGWKWSDGLRYYVDVHDASSIFYIDRLEKGKYILEYDLWANNPGDFSCGIATIQCMYAPEFRCNTHGTRFVIK